jgi:hypothetical protein
MLRGGSLLLLLLALAACEVERIDELDPDIASADQAASSRAHQNLSAQERLDQYTVVRLTTDLPLSDADRAMLPVLIRAAAVMDEVFWYQAFGDGDSLLARVPSGPERALVQVNYGPWDRLRGDEPFLDGAGTKPLGANFYPAGVTREDILAAADRDPEILDPYTLVRRDTTDDLAAIPYHVAFQDQHERAAELLREAAALATYENLQHYLELRAEALLTDDYRASDLAWLDLQDNTLDVIIGPIETYEDQLFGAKTGHEAYILVKDREWSARLARYADLLPGLQRGLPVPEQYRAESPGSNADLGAYDIVFYAGHANAGSKTIAVNLPNDEEVQRERGTRRLQLQNAMRAKFDHILMPIANVLIAPDQRSNITFDAFFENVMFHEVAHGLGVWTVVDGSGRTVREALREHAAPLEEGKADVLGLYMIQTLSDQGELGADHAVMDNYVTFLASIFRSIRFGSASAHGIANLIRFNYFQEHGAFTRSPEGQYLVNPERLRQAVDSLSERILRLQGDGDHAAVSAFVDEYGRIGSRLQDDLDRLAAEQIPVDVVFEQGPAVLGL